MDTHVSTLSVSMSSMTGTELSHPCPLVKVEEVGGDAWVVKCRSPVMMRGAILSVVAAPPASAVLPCNGAVGSTGEVHVVYFEHAARAGSTTSPDARVRTFPLWSCE